MKFKIDAIETYELSEEKNITKIAKVIGVSRSGPFQMDCK